ncbi:hypothetical protein ACIGXC_12050 [Streptomyces paradoxus]|uniref:hypothetical protein n=1 Tax=Streptomyces paradoxus TaxID=66375 RepID=UPI0037CE4449
MAQGDGSSLSPLAVSVIFGLPRAVLRVSMALRWRRSLMWVGVVEEFLDDDEADALLQEQGGGRVVEIVEAEETAAKAQRLRDRLNEDRCRR